MPVELHGAIGQFAIGAGESPVTLRLRPLRELAQDAIENDEGLAWRSTGLEYGLVDARIAIAKEQVDRRIATITTRPAGHLVELDVIERQVIQDDMLDIGNVDTLAEGARGDDAAQLPFPEGILDSLAVGL